MIRFNALSIRHKLILIMLATSITVLLFSGIAFMANDVWTLKQTMENDLKMQTRITATYAISTVQFGDADLARETLNALSANSNIVLAQLYPAHGEIPIATYQRPSNLGTLPLLGNFQQIDTVFSSNSFLQYSLTMTAPDGEQYGYIMLMMDRKPIYDRLYYYSAIALTIMFFSTIVAYFLSVFLQHLISYPILKLADLTYRVSSEKNYTLRAHSDSTDEMLILYTGFNEMLSAIQERDEKLEKHREHLEQTVANRTAELKKLNLKLTYQAYHDALTNLPNRALFVKRAEQAINYADENNEILAMLFIDLDRFKYINDTLGHAAGDKLLQEVADRLLSCTRQPEDTVARLGGDEFTLLLRDIKEPTNAGIVAEQIIKALTAPFSFNQQDLYITPSIGISIYPKDGRDVGSLMKNADASMYMAKNQGRNNYRFYVSSANADSATRLSLEHKLRQALECGEFEVWYQPRYDIRSGRIISAEALIRWRSPELSLVSPAQFIPLAEETGLIIPIGEWVLRTACKENLSWQQKDRAHIHVSVNLSARQFIQENLLNRIESIIEEVGIDPRHLELELTESLIMPNAEDTIETLRAIKKLGIQISVDDFGTGYSSLSYLKRFPIDTLKIDQSFVRDISEDEDDRALVTAIIAMAHNLKLAVVAEGVETLEQLVFLRTHSCDYVQGYLFGKPVPSAEFHEMLKNPVNFSELLSKHKIT